MEAQKRTIFIYSPILDVILFGSRLEIVIPSQNGV